MLDIKKLFSKQYWVYYLMALFFISKLAFALKYHLPIWDEAVYLSIGKYFYSLGNSGFLETLRPLFFPLMIGLFWKLTGNFILYSELLVMLFACGNLLLVYVISKRLFNLNTALASATLLAITQLFFVYSSYLLTGIPSTLFVLLAFYLLLTKRYWVAGLFSGLAFLTRFPQAIAVFAIIFYFIVEFLRAKKRKDIFFSALKFGAVFIATIIPFFVFNYLIYRPETANWFHAAFRPLIFASKAITGYGWLYHAGFWFYFKELFLNNFLLALALPGFVFFFKKRFYKRSYLLFIILLFFFAYFSWIQHKELRYGLIFLPYLAIFAGLGIAETFSFLYRKKRNKRYLFWLFCAFLICSTIYLARVDSFSFAWRAYEKPAIVSENYEFLLKNPVVGTVLTTDPLIGVYIDNRIYPAYYSMQVFEWALKEINYSAIYFTPRAFPCQETDIACQNRRARIIENILLNNNLIFNRNYEGTDYYIFSNKEYYTKLPKDELYIKYGLTQSVRLSRFPGDEFPVVLILEDFPSLDDNLEDIWQREQYEYVKNFFESKGVRPSIAVIPTHLEKLDKSEIDYLKDKGFEVIQNGHSHKDELSLSFAEQKELIKEGKEIIEDLLGQEVKAFIPPFYSANKDTARALAELNFTIYISTIGDPNQVPMARYDQSLTMISNWNERQFKTKQELAHEVRHVKNFNDYLLVSIYYYMFDEHSYNVLDDFYEPIKDDFLVNVQDLYEWQQFFSEVKFDINGSEISVVGEPSELSKELTLLFLTSGDFSLKSDYEELSIKSISKDLIKVCINSACYDLEPEEIVLIKS